MATQSLLYQRQIPLNEKINIRIPTVGEILENEDEYYGLVFSLTASPIDMMVQLDDINIDFSTLNDYELFLLLFPNIQKQDTHLVFGDLNLSKFAMAVSGQNGSLILVDKDNGIRIDRAIHGRIAAALRKIHHLEKDFRKPANKEARDFMLERARTKLKREKNRKHDSQLESLIISMVNTEQYKYDFESTKSLSIFQFNACVHQIVNKVNYSNRMYGVYAGTINAKELKPDELNWLYQK